MGLNRVVHEVAVQRDRLYQRVDMQAWLQVQHGYSAGGDTGAQGLAVC
jgi:hypothetical protein